MDGLTGIDVYSVLSVTLLVYLGIGLMVSLGLQDESNTIY